MKLHQDNRKWRSVSALERWLSFSLTCGILAIFAIAGQSRLTAQTTFGSILGTVTDQSGAAIPGVTVTLTSLTTQTKVNAQTNSTGNYQFLTLEPTSYAVDFEKSGFNHLKRTSITVPVQAAVRVDATLQSAQSIKLWM